MSNTRPDDRERAQELMMAALDGELSAADRVEWERALAGDEELRAEWERQQTVKEVTGTMTYREPPEEVWDAYWVSVYNKAERGIGWLFLSLGAIVVFGWIVWVWIDALLGDTALPWFVKGAIFAVVLGAGILFVSVAREKWFTRKNDPYKEVRR